MARYRALAWTLAGLVLISLACNAFAGAPEAPLPPPPLLTLPSSGPAATAVPVEDAAPTATLPVDATPAAAGTAGAATLQALVDLNVRTGPGVNYGTDGFLSQGDLAVILGQDPASGWWQVVCPQQSTGAACWVSGRAQYTAVSNAADVPAVRVPPTPTVAPQSVGPIVAYVAEGRLFVLPLDRSQTPPRAGVPRALGARSDVQTLWLSPDGRRVAYLVGQGTANELYVAALDGSDDRLLASSAMLRDLLTDMTPANAEPASVSIDSVAWAPDGRQLLFNTAVRDQALPAVAANTDLWRVTLDGELTRLLEVGAGGATLAVSPAGQVLLGQSQSLLRASLDGGGLAQVLTFALVNTAGERPYYPRPQWTTDGAQAFVAIPDLASAEAASAASLWLILQGGPAVQLGSLSGRVELDSVRWSPDGTRLAYVRQPVGDSSLNEPVLMVANADGRAETPYQGAAQLTLFDWSPSGARFLYAGPQFYAIGQPGAASRQVEIPAALRVADMLWLDEAWFLAALGSGNDGAWTLFSTDLAGNAAPLHTINAPALVWDVWTPSG